MEPWSGQPTADATDHVRPFHVPVHALLCCDEQQVKDFVELDTPTAPTSITITSLEPSWLSIRNSDGSELFEGTLAESKTLPADADVEIYAGRPDLVLISRGDETPKALGTIEQVRWYKLNP